MIEFHADDYGMFGMQSRRIQDCRRDGCLNGVSIMPNGSYLQEGMEELRLLGGEIALTVHLNLVEGQCLSRREEVRNLIDEDGNFNISFGKLLIVSYIPFIRKRYKTQIKEELKNQIHAVMPYLEENNIRLDSHCHYHMLPVVYDAMMEAIREERLRVTYIRMPRESMGLYWRHRKELENFQWINLVKVLCLNTLYLRNCLHSVRMRKAMDKALFAGVMFSGNMSYRNVSAILPDVAGKAERLKQDAEILFHPGAVYEKEDFEKLTADGDKVFLSSESRKAEARALHLLKETEYAGNQSKNNRIPES
ncbi:MAG: ChbG/HpnK family deacetylase [Lachnospiraceae bacterium]|nr:ChbG/HpnK family deacetylase [Lachnospiraceae bacterium]